MRQGESVLQPLLDALLEVGAQGASRDHLLKVSGASRVSFYRLLETLQEQNSLQEEQGLYRLPMAHLPNYRLKMWRDVERLKLLNPDLQQQILGLIDRILIDLGESLVSLWLVGSAAHATMTEGSDLDFLAVVKKKKDYFPQFPIPVQFLEMTPAEFEKKFYSQDNFVVTAIRHGLLLEDRAFARKFLDIPIVLSLSAQKLRDLTEDFEYRRGRILSFIRESATEDLERAFSSYAINLGRALLSTYGELPAGKPDLLERVSLFFGKPIHNILSHFIHRKPSGLKEFYWLDDLWTALRNHHKVIIEPKDYLFSRGSAFARESLEIWRSAKLREDLPLQAYSTLDTLAAFDLDAFKNTGPGVLIINPERAIPAHLRNPSWPPQAIAWAKSQQILLVTSAEVLQARNTLWLTGQKTNYSKSVSRFACQGLEHSAENLLCQFPKSTSVKVFI